MENSTLIGSLLIAATLGSGMMAGLFAAFSTFMMKALADLQPQEGIRAMQSINRKIVRPSFLLVFLGTGVLCAALVVLCWERDFILLVVSAAGVYLIACIASTVVFNVPLNEQLDKADPDSEAGKELWQRYLKVWTRWNHVRAIATTVSTILLALAITGISNPVTG